METFVRLHPIIILLHFVSLGLSVSLMGTAIWFMLMNGPIMPWWANTLAGAGLGVFGRYILSLFARTRMVITDIDSLETHG